MIANDSNFSILAETEDYIVVDKPAPLKVHPNAPDGVPTLYDELRALLVYELTLGGQISIINRLDRETSGVTLVAKTREAARRFGLAMMAHEFRKTYQAIVFGHPDWEAMDVDAPILRKGEVAPSPIYVKQMVHASGAACQTGFRVLQRFRRQGRDHALIECRPQTGRMHQIRVHLAHLGHPLVGDKLYGFDETCYLRFIETGWQPGLAEQLLLPRQALHASCLELANEGCWVAPLPPMLRDFVVAR
jgi:23S rRNA pseudouridine1911/1915/1917 synthase